MKSRNFGKYHLAMGILFTSASCNIYAQSSVTLYGLVDAGLNYLSNAQTGRSNGSLVGHSQYSFQDGVTGGQNGSRWGLLGTEDLGGGMSAIFRLESGFAINTGALGQGGAGMGRQAYVGLKSNVGTITMGRQYDPVATLVGPFSAAAQWGGYMSAHAIDVDNFLNTRRINNSIKYQSRDFNGLSLMGMYSFGGVPGSVSRNQVWSTGLAYTHGAFSAGAAYLNARNPNLGFYGTNPNAGTTPASNNIGSVGSADSPQSNPIYAGYASANTVQIIGAGAAYVIGSATVGATYSNVQFKGLGNTATSGPNPFGYGGNATFNVAEANLKYQITPALLAGVAYSYTHNSGAEGKASATYHQGSLGLDYFLSKRTDVYTIFVYQHASGTDSFGQSAVAQITGQTPSATNNQAAVRIGLRHRF
jgi:predicted porin